MNDSSAELARDFAVHEGICAQRWDETISRIKRLETILIGTAGAIILLLSGIVMK